MNNISQQLLRNPDIKPTNQVIAKGLGEANNTYIRFVNDLKNMVFRLWSGVTIMTVRLGFLKVNTSGQHRAGQIR